MKNFIFFVLIGIAVILAAVFWNDKARNEFAQNENPQKNQSEFFQKIFSENKISVLNFGDTMLGRNVGQAIERGNNPFASLPADWLQNFDLIALNLEGPITSSLKCQTKDFSFRFATTTAELLKKNNISVVNMANNHIFDCFDKGVSDTEKYLTSSGISYFGDEANPFTMKEMAGNFIYFVGVDLTLNPKLNQKKLELVRELKQKGNIVIVNVHWGIEYAKNPSDEQISIGREIIDAGADAIIGHHPHIIQPMEIYKNKPIFYSLGNFIFDQIGYEQNRGVGAGLIFENGKLIEIYIFPYQITKHQPKLLLPEEAEKFCEGYLKNHRELSQTPCVVTLTKP